MAIKKFYKIIIKSNLKNEDIIIGLIYYLLDINSFEEVSNCTNKTFYFFMEQSKLDLIKLTNIIKEKIEPLSELVEIKKIDYDPSIETKWKKYFKPFNITKNIVIRPSWEKYKKKPKEHVIILDPGMAFGTGLHQTTKGTLIILESIKNSFNKNTNLLDAGTGSAILSLVANKLGIKTIDAFDIDKEAIDVASKNIKLNKVNSINCFISDFKSINKKYDIILANIISNTLIKNYKYFENYSKKDSYVILSGIMKNEKEKIIKTFTNNKKFSFLKNLDLDEWSSMLFQSLK